MRATWLVIAVVAATGCKRAEPTPVHETPSTTTSASAPPLASTAPEELAPPAGASREEHERLALAILTGERDVSRLPEVSTEPGAKLDLDLRDELAPRKPGAKVRIGRLSVAGKVSPDWVQRSLRQNFPRFIGCYNRGLARNPTLQGDVQVQFKLDAQGSVKNAEREANSLPDSDVVSCVVKVVASLTFPANDGDVEVHAPLVFQPAD